MYPAHATPACPHASHAPLYLDLAWRFPWPGLVRDHDLGQQVSNGLLLTALINGEGESAMQLRAAHAEQVSILHIAQLGQTAGALETCLTTVGPHLDRLVKCLLLRCWLRGLLALGEASCNTGKKIDRSARLPWLMLQAGFAVVSLLVWLGPGWTQLTAQHEHGAGLLLLLLLLHL